MLVSTVGAIAFGGNVAFGLLSASEGSFVAASFHIGIAAYMLFIQREMVG